MYKTLYIDIQAVTGNMKVRKWLENLKKEALESMDSNAIALIIRYAGFFLYIFTQSDLLPNTIQSRERHPHHMNIMPITNSLGWLAKSFSGNLIQDLTLCFSALK